MRCPQCGFDSAAGAAFCARCGARLMAPRPETRHEYALARILPSWWHFSGAIMFATLIFVAGIGTMAAPRGNARVGLLGVALAGLLAARVSLVRRYTSWSLTSDRLIERSGFLATRRREMELADVRSIEVERSAGQRMLGLGDVKVASAASGDFMIKLFDIPDPERMAEILRKARLKRLA